ncbi:hypothetical protein R3P38DRAFT_2953379 [Favolaschia claudopus]|uniref:F-box domain-containing protein n=1 Tax=Favolaschia claudopus TaxID=2862362 RepID=A0AAW0BGU5_9AGAR
MHAALLLDDVLRQILDLCSKSSLTAVARTCSSWKDPALDGIWCHLGSLIPLLNLLPGLVCVGGVHDIDSETPLDFTLFNSYACRVKHITERHTTRLHPRLLSLLSPLPRLITTRLSSTDSNCLPAALSLSASLRQLDLDSGFRKKKSDAYNGYVEALLSVATHIERVRLRGLVDPCLNTSISQMYKLRSLSLRIGTVLSSETLVAISTFPFLSELEVEAAHIDFDNAVFEEWSQPHSHVNRFQALKKLHIRAQAPLIELMLKIIPPASLHTLRIEATPTLTSRPIPVCWTSLFDTIMANASYTLHTLTIEQHLDDIDDTIDTSPSSPRPNSQNDRIAFDTMRRLVALRLLRRLIIDTTHIPTLSDTELEALATWWPNLEHLDLGSLHSSECHPATPTSKPRATLGCLQAFASALPELHTLILPLDLDVVVPPLSTAHSSKARPSVLERATFSSLTPPASKAIAPYLHALFPQLTAVDGMDSHENEWNEVRNLLKDHRTTLRA